ncbi:MULTISPECIES: hypothetical protein [unclassified Sphingopyxis]|uniref:hypothetical protein n=1 Tax=unclassified Sphingopyxis TaxID=2614943 RepID=UPI0028577CE0|nr:MULTISPECIES: hypothetical protein [unclassified Sphingopyxis]MDR7061994.1 hypothetical protein [Sphingopyxis sp. BE235]MDR7182453.1 hypothetical protein [Sphingopyxis sp. BE249]
MTNTLQKPRLLILGHARHGKDTVAEILRDKHGFDFRSSSFFVAEQVVRPELARRGIVYDSLEDCYADRVNHRATWRDIIADYNEADPSRLSAAILEVADVYVGMRTHREFVASYHLFDEVAWVDASGRGVPPEGSDSMDIEYNPALMLRIDNNGALADLEAEVDRFVGVLATNYVGVLPRD